MNARGHAAVSIAEAGPRRRRGLEEDEPDEPCDAPCGEQDSSERGPSGDRIAMDLLRHGRTIVISEEVSCKLTSRLIPQILWLDMQSRAPIRVLVNTPGGAADDGFAIHDVIKCIKAPVWTIAAGLTASAGTIILLAAPRERRLTFPNTRLMIHQPAGGAQGQASDIEITANEIVKLRRRANDLIARECGLAVEQVEKDTRRDHWLDAAEACTYGLCSRVIASLAEIPVK
ncbi:MAG TPA: ATP-dependent Clp protease proteolytic subunit [Planctomycetes bacterium]|nr:ATP-dependent Clp protease proteolytic subunit [Planctomycetota bacterium]